MSTGLRSRQRTIVVLVTAGGALLLLAALVEGSW
jgi:hypothetical protein